MMKRLGVLITGVIGLVLFALLLPGFEVAQPAGISVTRDEARRIADEAARQYGIPVDDSWSILTWDESQILQEELAKDSERRRAAESDPVMGPRLSGYMAIYYRQGLEKYPYYGHVLVGKNGAVLSVRRVARVEEDGANPTADQLRPRADAFLQSQRLPGADHPVFESARPSVQRGRTDHTFRYRVAFPLDNIAAFINVYFVGDELAGWDLSEEYADGSQFRFTGGSELASLFLQYGIIGIILVTLLVIFLKKYHAGEVGVGTGAILMLVYLALSIVVNLMTIPEQSRGTGLGGADALTTALGVGGFKFLFYDLPVALMLFFGWSVGESYARARWGDRLASFDALAHHQVLNATVGRSLLNGVVLSPVVGAALLLPPFVGMFFDVVHATLGTGSFVILGVRGSAAAGLIYNVLGSMLGSVVTILFVLSFFNRLRLLPLGFAVSAVVGIAIGTAGAPVGPTMPQLLLGFGGALAGAFIFYFTDVLTSAIALLGGSMLVTGMPYLRAAVGDAQTETFSAMVAPLAVLLLVGIAGLATRKEISYEYEDLAPHVRRIIERERIRAEIDAANRIQAALLPEGDPRIPGITVASHYRAATEIGGDYFDFLTLGNGDIGIAFGDVAGHGLTSGIVMAMAKSALLVQVEYDSSPKRVMEVLNDTVMKVAPKRMMMTFFFGRLDPDALQLRFSSAGHLDPYVYRARDGRIQALSAWGYPLGIRRRDPFREMEVSFDQGDRLVLYSDGLIEAINDDGEPFGFKRFEDVLVNECDGTADEIRAALLGSVKKFTKNRPPEDDQTLVVISFDRPQLVVAGKRAERDEVVVQ